MGTGVGVGSGAVVGTGEGCTVGIGVGATVGRGVGIAVGTGDGTNVGIGEGMAVGSGGSGFGATGPHALSSAVDRPIAHTTAASSARARRREAIEPIREDVFGRGRIFRTMQPRCRESVTASNLNITYFVDGLAFCPRLNLEFSAIS